MPRYTVTDPRTGKKVTITTREGDPAPTEEEIEEVLRTQVRDEGGLTQAEREQRIQELDAERAELARRNAPPGPGNDPRMGALTLGSAAIAEPISGLAGIAGGVSGLLQNDVQRKMQRLGLGEGPTADPIFRAADWVENTRDFLTIAPQNPASERALELVGVGGESLIETVRLPFAGLAGVSQLPFEGVEGAAETTRRVREEGIGRTGARALERIGAPPSVTAAVETLPTAVATIAGTKFPARRFADDVGDAAALDVPAARHFDVPDSDGPVSVGRPSFDQPVDMTPGRPSQVQPETQQIIRDIRRTRRDNLADDVAPDPEIIESAQRLGIDLNVEHYSTNTAFQSVARALKNQPESRLLEAELIALDKLTQEADNLVMRIGGSLDRGAISDEILITMRQQVNDMRTEAGRLYTQVDDAIPARTRVNTEPLQRYIDQRLEALGGNADDLRGVERELHNLLQRHPEGSITYGLLDDFRKQVGDGFTRSGPFADAGQRTLSIVYDQLSDIQQNAVTAFGGRGLADDYARARQLVADRKALEDQIVSLFGREIGGDLAPRIRQSALQLPGGGMQSFRRLMNALPEAERQRVAAMVLSDVFAAGGRQGGQLSQGFAKVWRRLNRNQTARDLLYDALDDPRAVQIIDDIGRVMDAITRSNRPPMGNPSGSSGPIIRAIQDGSMAARLYQTMEHNVTGRVPVVGRIVDAVETSPARRLDAANDLLTSQAFKDAVAVSLEGNLAKANQILEGSPQYRQWITTVPEGTANEIARVGIISWLSSEEDEQ